MARGWGSKSVEEQIEMAQNRGRRTRKSAVPAKSQHPGAVETVRKRESLRLSVIHVTQELKSTQNPRYRALLEKALADLQAQIDKTRPAEATPSAPE